LTASTVVPLIVALLALAGTLANLIVQRRKVNAETDSVTVATALSLLPDLRAEIERLKRRLDELEDSDHRKGVRIDDLEVGVRALTSQVIDLGHTPAWPPVNVTIRHEGEATE
jgi:hypothetical protein